MQKQQQVEQRKLLLNELKSFTKKILDSCTEQQLSNLLERIYYFNIQDKMYRHKINYIQYLKHKKREQRNDQYQQQIINQQKQILKNVRQMKSAQQQFWDKSHQKSNQNQKTVDADPQNLSQKIDNICRIVQKMEADKQKSDKLFYKQPNMRYIWLVAFLITSLLGSEYVKQYFGRQWWMIGLITTFTAIMFELVKRTW